MLKLSLSSFLEDNIVSCVLSLESSESFSFIKAMVGKYFYREEKVEWLNLDGFSNFIKTLDNPSVSDKIIFEAFKIEQKNRLYDFILAIQVSAT